MNSEDLTRAIGRTALAAMLYEVAASPKPGLVDPFSAGAHSDMDYFTFLSSAAALAPYFVDFARIGAESEGGDPSALLPALRRAGIEAESAMFAATAGANTHKGLIFSMGLLCAASGRLAAKGERLDPEICARTVSEIVAGICARELEPLTGAAGSAGSAEGTGAPQAVATAPHTDGAPGDSRRSPLTSGEALFLRFGVRGIRGEAEAGFLSVINHALPRLRADLAAGSTYNDAMIDALLELCLYVDDTTVLNRAGIQGLAHVRTAAGKALARGGMSSAQGRDYIHGLDADFSARGLSPGGCADLLAVTVFLDKLPDDR